VIVVSYYIYKLLDHYDRVIYVGQSVNVVSRVAQHRSDSKMMYAINRVYYSELKNKAEMNLYEMYYINKYLPRYNTQRLYDGGLELEIKETEWLPLEDLQKEIYDKELDNYCNGNISFESHAFCFSATRIEVDRIVLYEKREKIGASLPVTDEHEKNINKKRAAAYNAVERYLNSICEAMRESEEFIQN